MEVNGGRHSIFFPTAVQSEIKTVHASMLAVFLGAQADATHIYKRITNLTPSKGLHGDLQSLRTAAVALRDKLDVLIKAEEQ